MIDIELFRKDPKIYDAEIKKRGMKIDISLGISLDSEKRPISLLGCMFLTIIDKSAPYPPVFLCRWKSQNPSVYYALYYPSKAHKVQCCDVLPPTNKHAIKGLRKGRRTDLLPGP